MEHWSGDTCCMYKGFCSQIHFAGVLICDKVWLKKKEFRFTYHMGHFFPEWRTVANQRKVNGFEPSFPTDYNSGAKNIDLGQINSHFFPSILLLFSSSSSSFFFFPFLLLFLFLPPLLSPDTHILSPLPSVLPNP